MRKLMVGISLTLLLSACGNSNPTPVDQYGNPYPYSTSQAPVDPYGTTQYPYNQQYYQDPNYLQSVQDIPQQQSQPGYFVYTFDGVNFLGTLAPLSDPQSLCLNTAALQSASNPQNNQPPVVWYWDGSPYSQPQFQAYISSSGVFTPRYDPSSIYSSLCR